MYFYFYFWPLILIAEIPKQTPYNFSVRQQLFLSSKPGWPVVEQQKDCRHIILKAEYCNADRTTWKLTLQDINTTPKELTTERDCSHRQLFRPLWGSSVWRNNQRSSSDEKTSAHSDYKNIESDTEHAGQPWHRHYWRSRPGDHEVNQLGVWHQLEWNTRSGSKHDHSRLPTKPH